MKLTALHARLSLLAVELDEASAQLDGAYLTDGEAALLAAPLAHLWLALWRLEELLHEVDAKLDDRPRRQRLALEAA